MTTQQELITCSHWLDIIIDKASVQPETDTWLIVFFLQLWKQWQYNWLCILCNNWASVSEPHTYGVAGAEMRNIFLSYVKEAPGSKFVTRGGAGRPIPLYHTRRARVAAPAGQPWMYVRRARETRQPICNTCYQS